MTRQKSDAAVFAEAVVAEFGSDCGLRLGEVAAEMGAKIVEIDSATYDGLLVRFANVNRGRIGISKHIPVEGRKRYTAAHELGHYLLGHGSEVIRCKPHEIESWAPTLRQDERDANTFAAELLMPRSVVQPLIATTPDFRQVEAMAKLCGTSLTASAVRLVELSTYQVVVVWSEAGRVVWYRTSHELKCAVRLRAVDDTTLAAACFRHGTAVEDKVATVPAAAWCYEDGLRRDAKLIEWSRAMPRYDGVLTFLYAPDFLEERTGYEDENEQELDPDEFTRSRRRWPP